jgi:hypothetical protein
VVVAVEETTADLMELLAVTVAVGLDVIVVEVVLHQEP